MTIDCFTTEKSGKIQLAHDLNFAAPTYDVEHTVTFRNPSQALQAILRETGPIPLDDAGAGKKKAGGLVGAGESKKRSKTGFDLEKMADGLVRLNEDDILQVIQMIHDNKSEDTITKNDVEGECD